MTNPYIARVEKLVSSKDINMTWRIVDEAKRYIANIQQLKKEIQLVKSEITLAKRQIHTTYVNQKAHIGTGFGAGMAKGIFGAKTMGKAHTVTRNNIRHRELQVLHPYEEAERFIAAVLAGLDKLKLEMKTWIETQRVK